jgi:hypothetical protein
MAMRKTVKDIMQILQTLPPDLPVEFEPISGAWMGTFNPMRVDDFHFYNDEGDGVLPLDKGARMVIHISEDRP